MIPQEVWGACLSTVIPLIFMIVILKDKKSKWLLAYFAWGVIASMLAFAVNTMLAMELGSHGEHIRTVVAPIVEEVLKCLPVLLFLVKKIHPSIDKTIVYCAMSCGIGFSVLESIYYVNSIIIGSDAFVIVLLRTITTALMHGMTVAVLGAGLYLTRDKKHIFLPLIFGLCSLAATIHAIYNLLLPTKAIILVGVLPLMLYFAGMLFLYDDDTPKEDNDSGHRGECKA